VLKNLVPSGAGLGLEPNPKSMKFLPRGLNPWGLMVGSVCS
jgi:hypothetical protein